LSPIRTMMRTTRPDLFVLAAILASALVVLTAEVSAFRQQQNPILRRQQHTRTMGEESFVDLMTSIRGGSLAIDVEIESSDEEETDDEEEEEIVPKLAKATKKAATKVVKKSVAAALKPKKKKKKSSLMKLFRLPYIVKACLNPIVFFQMTVGYWKSLYNIDYMTEKKDSSQDLRSALEQKARYGGGGKKSRGKRKMKPGQAKTLSDLPVLNT